MSAENDNIGFMDTEKRKVQMTDFLNGLSLSTEDLRRVAETLDAVGNEANVVLCGDTGWKFWETSANLNSLADKIDSWRKGEYPDYY